MRGRRIIRFIWFGISIIVGLVLGLLAGWSKSVDTSDTSFSKVRQDFQIDIVLMTAEVYHKDGDLEAAKERLAYLNVDDMVLFVQQAVMDAKTIGYAQSDLKIMSALAQDLEKDMPSGSGNSS